MEGEVFMCETIEMILKSIVLEMNAFSMNYTERVELGWKEEQLSFEDLS